MENLFNDLLVKVVFRLPFNERVTFGLVSRKFRAISLTVMRRETKLVIKDYGRYGKVGRWIQMPDSVWDNNCLCLDRNHLLRVQDVIQTYNSKEEETRLKDMSRFLLNYCLNISTLCLDLGRISQCVVGNPRSERGLPRIMFNPILEVLESLLDKYQSQLVCLTLPSYSFEDSVFLFPKLKHLIVRSISEAGWSKLLHTSKKLEGLEFESKISTQSLSLMPLGLKQLHLSIRQEQDFFDDLFSSPAMKSLEVLRLEVYAAMTGGDFSLPNLQSLDIYVGHGTSGTVKSCIIQSLLNSKLLSELKVHFSCKDVPLFEWLSFLSVRPGLRILKANFPAEIIPTLVHACPLLEVLNIDVTDTTDDHLVSLSNLSRLKELTLNSEKGNLSAESVLSLIRGNSRDKLLRLRITENPLKIMADDIYQEIQNELFHMHDYLSLKETCIIIDESRVLKVMRKNQGFS